MVAAIGSYAAPLAVPDRFNGGQVPVAGRPSAPPQEENNLAATATELTEEEQKRVKELKKRDAEVRAHEQAHASAGGTLAGSPSYETERGPDGRTYAVGGDVSIDVSPAQTPSATMAKADQIVRAALAPADPSSQDMRVAASARQMRAEAQAELIRLQAEELGGSNEDDASDTEDDGDSVGPERPGVSASSSGPGPTPDASFTAQRAYDEATRLIGSLLG